MFHTLQGLHCLSVVDNLPEFVPKRHGVFYILKSDDSVIRELAKATLCETLLQTSQWGFFAMTYLAAQARSS